MLIKGTNRKGDAIPLTAREALKHAVGRLCKAVSTLDIVYWLDARTVVETAFKSMADRDGVWEAWAEGTADIGYTDAKTNNFHVPIPHTFKVNYKLCKDEWGLPDITVVGQPEFAPIERNPSKLAGPMPDPAAAPDPSLARPAAKIKKSAEEQIK